MFPDVVCLLKYDNSKENVCKHIRTSRIYKHMHN